LDTQADTIDTEEAQQAARDKQGTRP